MALFQQKKSSTVKKNNYFVELTCGRMNMNDDTKMVEPEPSKGLLYVYRSKDDQLVHLCWQNSTTETNLSDLIVFEGDCVAKQIKQLPEHRVFFIRFNQTKQRQFFWFQHTDKEKDEQLITDLNNALNNQSEAEKKLKEKAKSSMPGVGKKIANKDFRQLQQIAGQLGANPQELMEWYQSGVLESIGFAPSAGEESTPASAANSNTVIETPKASGTNGAKKKVKLDDLNAALAAASKPVEKFNLSKALNTDSLIGMLSNKEVQDKLAAHLPENEKFEKTGEEIRATVGSPQYQQAVIAFQEALESGQLGPVLQGNPLCDTIRAPPT